MAVRFALPKVPKISKKYIATDAELQYYKSLGYATSSRPYRGRTLVSKQNQPWEVFEEEVRVFFKYGLQLSDCGGGPLLKLGNNQIDAAGGIDRSFLIAECKTKRQLGARSLRQDLQMLYAKQHTIKDQIKKQYKNRYDRCFFVMALHNITPSDQDVQYALDHGIAIWTQRYFESLRALYLTIGTRVRYYVLKELGREAPLVGGGRTLSFPAVEVVKAKNRIYSLFIPAATLLDIAYVLRIESGQKDAYQRLLDRKRLRDIARYIEDGRTFKNSIVVALEGDAVFNAHVEKSAGLVNANSKAGILTVPRRFASAWIIDGQHRLYGFARVDDGLARATLLPVVALQSESRTEDAQTFVDINKNQKAVDPSLLWSLVGQLDPYSIDGVISDLVAKLASEKTSALKNRIFVPNLSRHNRRSYGIFQSNLCESINSQLVSRTRRHPLLVRAPISPQEKDRVLHGAFRTMNQYFKLLCSITDSGSLKRWQNDFFFRNNGANIVLRVLAEILDFTGGQFTAADFRARFAPGIQAYLKWQVDNIDGIRQRASSEGTRAQEAFRLMRSIADRVDGFARELIRKQHTALQSIDPYKTMSLIENTLRDLVSSKLRIVTKKWWVQKMPPDVRENAEARKKRGEASWWMTEKVYPVHDYVDFPDYRKIIRRNWEEAFKPCFPYAEWIDNKLRELEPVRNNIAHYRELSELQLETLKLFAKQIVGIAEGKVVSDSAVDVMPAAESEDLAS